MVYRPTALVIMGTRPEAIKLSPVVRSLKLGRALAPIVCATAQHRGLLDRALQNFQHKPHIDLNLMRDGQTPQGFAAAALDRVTRVVQDVAPAVTVVQGDTTTAAIGALASFYAGVPVAHVEAGLRTGDLRAPFPEEGHRRIIAAIAALHFAPSDRARLNLVETGVLPDRVVLSGNTGIDSLMEMSAAIDRSPMLRSRLKRRFPYLDRRRPLVVVTAHRRENLGEPLKRICAAISQIAERAGADFVIPVHPNPEAARLMRAELAGALNAHLTEPLRYSEIVWLLRQARLVLTDSGGLQEEAATMGVPVLILREATERQEVVEAGLGALVGSDPKAIGGTTLAILRDPALHAAMARATPLYGCGTAAPIIARVLGERFGMPVRAQMAEYSVAA
jgi:UDP-N-acetylglucosamine 2-epimerase (non-hydrolysing)